MVNKHIRDDLLIEGSPNSLYSKITKPPNKQLQLEGTIDITSISSTAGDITLKGKIDIDDDGAEAGQLNVDGTDTDGSAIRVNGVHIADYVHSFNVRAITSTPATLTASDKIIDVNVSGATPPDRIWVINFPAATANKFYKIHVHGKVGPGTGDKSGVVWMKPSATTEWMDGQRESASERKALPIQAEGTYVFRAVINYRASGANGWIIDTSHSKHYLRSPYLTAHGASTANLADLTSDLDAGGTIDGITLAAGMNFLLKNQTTASENGLYVIPAAGGGVAPDRIKEHSLGEHAGSTHIAVNSGTANSGKMFKVDNAFGSDIIGTDNLTLTEFGATTSPAGSDTEIQFNNSGAFGGSADLTWDGTDLSLSNDKKINVGASGEISDISGSVFTVKAKVGASLQIEAPSAGNIIISGPTTGTVQLGPSSTSGNITVGNALSTGNIFLGNYSQTGFIKILCPTLKLEGDAPTIECTSTAGDFTLKTVGINDCHLFPIITGNSITVGSGLTTGNINLGSSSQTGIVDVKSELRLSNKGTVTQATSATTTVVLNKPLGVITTVSLVTASDGRETFTVTNSYATTSSIILADVIEWSGSDNLNVSVSARANGSFNITIFNNGGSSLGAVAKIAFVIL